MKTTFRIVSTLVLFWGMLFLLMKTHALTQQVNAGIIGQEIIISLDPSLSHSDIALLLQQISEIQETAAIQNLRPIQMSDTGLRLYIAEIQAGIDITELISNLQNLPGVLRVELNVERTLLSIDPDGGPFDEEFTYQDYYFDIGVVAMWARGLTGMDAGNTITVAVIDTGVDIDHPDIDGNLVAGYDFVEDDHFPQDVSNDSHGSMVSGIISAEINNDFNNSVARGVAGIGGGDALAGVPGLQIMPLRVSDGSSVDCATSAQAVDYARTHGADIINFSYAGEEYCQLEYDAIQNAYDDGIVLVAGAGNENSEIPHYPAAYGAGINDHLVIAVAGVYPSGAKADASNYGTWIDISAPFRNIRSLTNDGGYASASGTSFSAPFVSGLFGVLMSNYGWNQSEVIAVVLATAEDIDSVNPDYQGLLGSGRINAELASRMYNVYLPFIVSLQN